MPSASATATEKTIGVREDGAIICKHKLPRGRCNKLVVTESVELRCPNGHLITLNEAVCEAANRPGAGQDAIWHCNMTGNDLRPLIRRLASSEFLGASEESWQKMWMDDVFTFRPDYFVDMLAKADISEPECGRMLREYWEQRISLAWPDVVLYLRKMKHENSDDYVRFREQALLAFQRRGLFDPLRHLAWSEVSLEAVKRLGGEHEKRAVLYRHNIAESIRLITSKQRFPSPAPFYFRMLNCFGDYIFDVMPDPYWAHKQEWSFGQINVCLIGKRSFGRNICIEVTVCSSSERLKRNLVKQLEFLVSGYNKGENSSSAVYSGYNLQEGRVDARLPSNVPIDFKDPEFHLKVVLDFMEALYLRMGCLVRED